MPAMTSTREVCEECDPCRGLPSGSGCQRSCPSCLAASGQFGPRTEALWKPSGSRKQEAGENERPLKGVLSMCGAGGSSTWTNAANKAGTSGTTSASKDDGEQGREQRPGAPLCQVCSRPSSHIYILPTENLPQGQVQAPHTYFKACSGPASDHLAGCILRHANPSLPHIAHLSQAHLLLTLLATSVPLFLSPLQILLYLSTFDSVSRSQLRGPCLERPSHLLPVCPWP